MRGPNASVFGSQWNIRLSCYSHDLFCHFAEVHSHNPAILKLGGMLKISADSRKNWQLPAAFSKFPLPTAVFVNNTYFTTNITSW